VVSEAVISSGLTVFGVRLLEKADNKVEMHLDEKVEQRSNDGKKENELEGHLRSALSNPFATRHMWRMALLPNTSK
jgi:hypothetical protein